MNKIILLAIALFSFHNQSQSQSKKMPSFNHLAINVADLKKSNSFYANIIGLDTIPEPFHDNKHTWFSLGTKMALHVIESSVRPTIFYKGNHLCFSVASVEQITKMLKKHTIKWEDWQGAAYGILARPDGVKQIYLQDPDGYWIEINDAKQ